MITASEFTDDIINQDIQVKEDIALKETLQTLIREAPEQVKGTNVVCNMDNQAPQAVYNRKGTSKNLLLNSIGKQLYWLQETGDFLMGPYGLEKQREQRPDRKRLIILLKILSRLERIS